MLPNIIAARYKTAYYFYYNMPFEKVKIFNEIFPHCTHIFFQVLKFFIDSKLLCSPVP